MNKRDDILNHLRSHESATLEELYKNSRYSYYCNWQSNFSKVMSALVKQGLVERIKPGVFKLGKSKKITPKPATISNQQSLF